MRHHDIIHAASDVLSDLARSLLSLNPTDAYERLVVTGNGNPRAAEQLRTTIPAQLFSRLITHPASAKLVMAGLWLRHDWLDESHVIAQQVETPDGSYWHAIMHRREGDFSNSKYWLTRSGTHPIANAMAERLPDIIAPYPSDPGATRMLDEGWNPAAFVDLVEQFHADPHDARRPMAVAIQRLEWDLLFAHCAHNATA